MMEGIDVSDHQGDVQWRVVAERTPVEFAIVKASEGATFTARTFARNWDGSNDNGLRTGAYHYFKRSSTAKEQAAQFLRLTKERYARAYHAIPPTIDVEEGNANQALVDDVLVWLDIVEQAIGLSALFYSYPAFIQTRFAARFSGVERVSDRLLWIAHPTSRPSPTVPQPFDGYGIWQYTFTGQVEGISRPVDRNRALSIP